MCGIVGGVTRRPISKILLEGLKHLEYRGYDSAGMALLEAGDHSIKSWRVTGKVTNLETVVKANPSDSQLGIAHTRWATHGVPAQRNAHPHSSGGQFAIVHNGIIENHLKLQRELEDLGYQFQSETDSEVIAHLLHHYAQHHDFTSALQRTCQRLQGAYAIACIDKEQPDQLYAARFGSPLVIGLGIDENFVASDPLALLPVTRRFIFLEEGDFARITHHDFQIFDQSQQPVSRDINESSISAEQIDKKNYRHFMLKEIYQQPDVARQTLNAYLVNQRIQPSAFGHRATEILPTIKRIHIVACGTSFHAGFVAQYWLEQLAKIPTQIDIASEHRYRERVVEPNTLLIALSQSGETADTLAALRNASAAGYSATLAICNVASSSLAREADLLLLTRAGIEIGVAATKTFTAQLVALLGLALAMAEINGIEQHSQPGIQALEQLPQKIAETLALDEQLKKIAAQFIDKRHAIFLGRGIHYPIAMEGALKLKEISYLHAESYAAGELKHGPLALIDSDMPVVVVAPPSDVIDKVISNIKEVEARGGHLIIFTHHTVEFADNDNITLIHLDEVDPLISPIIYNIPLQLLAYHTAVYKGTDIDQPRNLAKSVTVE